MDFTMIIIITLLFIIFTIPVWLIIQAEKKKKRKFLQQLLEIGRQQQWQLSAAEVWQGKALGLDPINKGLVFMSQKQAAAGARVVPLQAVLSCKLASTVSEHTGKIEFQFVPKPGQGVVPSILFFDMNTDDPTQAPIHREKAAEWLSKIEACL